MNPIMNPLPRVRLGRTGIQVSELCLGTLIYGRLQARLSPEEGARAIRRAIELGITFIDTAKTYETYDHVRLGLAGTGRDDIVIASKSPAKTAAEMRTDVEAALGAMNREYLDVFHLHLIRSANDLKSREGALDALVSLRREGKIRATGISVHGVAGARAALAYPEIDVVFPLLNRKGLGVSDGTVDEMTGAIRELRDNDRGLYVMKPLGGGHLIDDIPGAIGYVRELGLFDAVAVGLKTVAEVEVMLGVFAGDEAAIARSREMGRDRTGSKRLHFYTSMCTRCGSCVEECAQGALSLGEQSPVVDPERCVLCGYCAAVCPRFAIRVV